jgi:hypothetical protein
MIVRALEKDKDPFRPKQKGEEVWKLNTHTSVLLVHLCT